jgi:hypothetical protein
MIDLLKSVDLGTIVTIVVSLIATFAGGFWIKGKGKLLLIGKLVKETLDVIDAFNDALKDDKIDKKELERIKTQFNELKAVFKDLFAKQVE